MENLKAIYGYQDIFKSSLPNDAFSFLQKYSTKNILIKIAHINSIIYDLGGEEHDRRIFEEVLFGQMSLARKTVNNLDYKLSTGSFFASPHLSELIKEALNNYSESQDDDLSYEEFAINLFRTILVFNEKYNNKSAAASNLTSFRDVFALGALQQDYIRTTRPITYFIKFAFMCKFLSEDVQLRDVTIKFCQDYGMASPWNISKFLMELYIDTDKKVAKFALEKTAVPAYFLKDWSINKEYITQKRRLTLNFDIIPRPLFESNEHELIMLDFNFFQYTVDQGFFYRIFEKNIKPIGGKLSNFNNFKSYIGTAYFENYLCKILLQKIFSQKQQVIYSDKKYQDFLIKTSSDNLLVIESKMTDVNVKALENIDFESFKEKIEENLLSKKEIVGKNKGAYQILQQLDQLYDDKNYDEISGILKIKNVKRLNIYPILLTSDTNYNILGTNAFVNEKCSTDFTEIKERFQSVNPVLILNVNTLIEYYDYFKRSKTNFTDLVKSYFKEIGRQKQQYNSGKDIYSYLMSSMSFDSYIQSKLKDETLIHHFESFSKDFATELSGLDFSPSPL
ncbi:hypothetical protein [Sphingobacterium sp. MYb382]|uniref:hypothetical protein n=1 Tax=Sphingobacterium sp. MYb382 TaxID=2745278 RepID=UPI00309BB0E9